jgi:uncharacterized protein
MSPTKLGQLHEVLAEADRVVVAYSGGTDSALVAAVAARTLGDRALAVTAVSPSLPPGEAEQAAQVAALLGIRHRTVRTREAELPAYLANGTDRCYRSRLHGYRPSSRHRRGRYVTDPRDDARTNDRRCANARRWD